MLNFEKVCQKINLNSKQLNKFINTSRNNILNKIFGSEYNNVKKLLSTLTENINVNHELKIDIINNHSNYQSYNFINYVLKSDDIKLYSCVDDLVHVYQSVIPINNITFHYSTTSDTVIRNINMVNLYSRSELKSLIPLNVQLNKHVNVGSIDRMNLHVSQYKHMYKTIYTFKSPKLCDWCIEKNTCITSTDINSSKLHVSFSDRTNYYDSLSISFRYIGNGTNLINSFFNLMEFIYYDTIDLITNYNILSSIIDINFESLIPTNDILTININEFMKQNDVTLYADINHANYVVLIIINNSLYEYSYNSFNEIITTSNISNQFNDQTSGSCSSINDLLMKYQYSRNQNVQYDISVLITKKHVNMYYVIDGYCINSYIIDTLNYDDRYNIINEFISNQLSKLTKTNTPDSLNIRIIEKIESNTQHEHYESIRSVNSVTNNISNSVIHSTINSNVHSTSSVLSNSVMHSTINGILCQINSKNTLNNIIYKVYTDECIINFEVHYIKVKNIFYLYVFGNTSNIIKRTSILNKYSTEHFGYSLFNNASIQNGHILFISPYTDTFEFKPSLTWDTNGFTDSQIDSINKIMYDMIHNPCMFNHKIIRMKLCSKSWIPLEVLNNERNKITNYAHAMNIMSSIFMNSITTNYPTHSLTHSVSISDTIRDIYVTTINVFNQFIIEKYINRNTISNIVDIFDENTLNVNKLFYFGNINNIYAVHNVPSNLIEYVNNSMKHDIIKTPFIHDTKIIPNRFMDINIVCNSFDINDNIVRSIMKKYNYKNNCIDIIYIQNLDTSIFTSVTNLLVFIDFAKSILSPNGIIVMKYYDINVIDNIIKNGSNPFMMKHIDKTISSNYHDNSYLNVSSLIMYYDDDTFNDQYQWDNLYLEMDSPIPYCTSFEHDKLRIDIDDEVIELMCKSTDRIDPVKHLVHVLYYHVFHRYNADGSFKYTKLINRNQTLNLSALLNIHTELISNMYEHMLDEWYSIYHVTDVSFGSIDYVQNVIKNDIEKHLLIESTWLNPELISFVNSFRLNSKFNTVIITKTNLTFNDQFIRYVHVQMNDDVNCYLIPSINYNQSQLNIITQLFNRIILNQSYELISNIIFPDMFRQEFIMKSFMNPEIMRLLDDEFNCVDICVPMVENIVSKYIASNQSFVNVNQIDELMSALTVKIYENK